MTDIPIDDQWSTDHENDMTLPTETDAPVSECRDLVLYRTDSILDDDPKTNADHFVESALNRLGAIFSCFEESASRTNEHLYNLLGGIFELAGQIDDPDYPELLGALKGRVRQISAVRKSNRWYVDDKTTFDLLVTMYLGLSDRTKVTKCQWLRALEAGKAADVNPEQAAFAEWIAERGGVIAAGRFTLCDQTDRVDTPKFELDHFLEMLPKIAEAADSVTFSIDQDFTTCSGLVVVLGRVPFGFVEPGQAIEILDVITDDDVVAEVVASHDKGRSAVAKFEADKLWTLNRITMKVDSRKRKYFKVREYLAFQKAFRALATVPSLKDKFFSGQPYLPYVNVSGDPSGETTIPVVNEQCHPLDPAKYIENAKPDVLMPYEHEGADTGKQWKSMYEYSEWNRLRKARPSKPTSRPGSTLAQFLDDPSDEAGHPDISAAIISPETPDANEGIGDVVDLGE